MVQHEYIGILFQSIRDRTSRTQVVFLLRVTLFGEGEPNEIRLHEPGSGIETLDQMIERKVKERCEANKKRNAEDGS